MSAAKRALVAIGIVVLGMIGLLMIPPAWPDADRAPRPPPGFDRTCTLIRDAWDVPHIEAATEQAAAYCWGKAHALDRGSAAGLLAPHGVWPTV